jgi:hypothetical protein
MLVAILKDGFMFLRPQYGRIVGSSISSKIGTNEIENLT